MMKWGVVVVVLNIYLMVDWLIGHTRVIVRRRTKLQEHGSCWVFVLSS